MQISLSRRQFRVAHHLLHGDKVEATNREAPERVPEIVKAPDAHPGFLLGPDEALANC